MLWAKYRHVRDEVGGDAGRNVSSVRWPAAWFLLGKFGIASSSPCCAGNVTSFGADDDFPSPISAMFGSIGDTTLAPGDVAV